MLAKLLLGRETLELQYNIIEDELCRRGQTDRQSMRELLKETKGDLRAIRVFIIACTVVSIAIGALAGSFVAIVLAAFLLIVVLPIILALFMGTGIPDPFELLARKDYLEKALNTYNDDRP